MQDDRSRLCRHIRAARNWLGQAERSLADEKDVQGDLKLMLAKAELQHAEERSGRAFRQFLPIATAGMLAAAVVFFLHAGDGTHKETAPPPPPPALSMPSASSTPPAALPPIVSAAPTEIAEATPAEEPDALPPPALQQESTEMEAVPPPAETRQYSSADIPAQTLNTEQLSPEIPSPDMQKLMQSAGKILREP